MSKMSLHGQIFLWFEKFLKNFGLFFDRNGTFKEFLFILLYAFEQFIIFFYFSKVSTKETFVGVMVLVVLTTISVDKLLLNRVLSAKNEELINSKNEFNIEKQKLYEKVDKLTQKYNDQFI